MVVVKQHIRYDTNSAYQDAIATMMLALEAIFFIIFKASRNHYRNPRIKKMCKILVLWWGALSLHCSLLPRFCFFCFSVIESGVWTLCGLLPFPLPRKNTGISESSCFGSQRSRNNPTHSTHYRGVLRGKHRRSFRLVATMVCLEPFWVFQFRASCFLSVRISLILHLLGLLG